jgi:hypothetical protein
MFWSFNAVCKNTAERTIFFFNKNSSIFVSFDGNTKILITVSFSVT